MMIGQPEAVFTEFTDRYGLEFKFTPEQTIAFQDGNSVVLSTSQMDYLADQIASQVGTKEFLERHASDIPAVCMSLYVLNEALWKLMERKPWDTEKMLPMTTMPYCFWHQEEEKTSNPKAVKRWEIGRNSMSYSSTSNSISIVGEGGDFSGFIDRSQITLRKFGIPEKSQLIPNYVYQKVMISAHLKNAVASIHPLPLENLDYDYSGPAKDFHDHGIHLQIPGNDITLEVEKRKPSVLNGIVHLFIGYTSKPEPVLMESLLADIWFWILYRLLQERN